MMDLFVTACLLAQPANCERFYVGFQEPVGIMECMLRGQLQAADWAKKHPTYKVRRWTCEEPRA